MLRAAESLRSMSKSTLKNAGDSQECWRLMRMSETLVNTECSHEHQAPTRMSDAHMNASCWSRMWITTEQAAAQAAECNVYVNVRYLAAQWEDQLLKSLSKAWLNVKCEC